MDAPINGLDKFPEIDYKIREELNNELELNGIKSLQKKLNKIDPDHFLNIDINNPRRIIRALEVCITSKKPYSFFLNKKKVNRSYKVFQIAINTERNNLYDLINNRVDKMIINGLLNEVKSLIDHSSLIPLQTVGYKELFPYFEKKESLETCIEEIKKNTRRYAKRQLTWLNRSNDLLWLDNKSKAEVIISTYFD